jgi:hypothetical protein
MMKKSLWFLAMMLLPFQVFAGHNCINALNSYIDTLSKYSRGYNLYFDGCNEIAFEGNSGNGNIFESCAGSNIGAYLNYNPHRMLEIQYVTSLADAYNNQMRVADEVYMPGAEKQRFSVMALFKLPNGRQIARLYAIRTDGFTKRVISYYDANELIVSRSCKG